MGKQFAFSDANLNLNLHRKINVLRRCEITLIKLGVNIPLGRKVNPPLMLCFRNEIFKKVLSLILCQILNIFRIYIFFILRIAMFLAFASVRALRSFFLNISYVFNFHRIIHYFRVIPIELLIS